MSERLAVIPETQKSKDNFYPTPWAVAQKMLNRVDWKCVSSILEPSAGKGDLAREAAFKLYELYKGYCEYNKPETYVPKVDLDCIEIDPNLAAILRDRGFRVVHDDFFTYRTNKRYDLILMNPPFEDGALHLMKALDMVADGGQVVCLLNAQTIRNPFSYDRQQLIKKLNELDADIEYISDAFTGAERKTDVEIAMIHAFVPYKVNDQDSLIMDHFRPAHKYADRMDQSEYDALAKGNFIDAIIDRYNYEVDCGLRLIHEWKVLRPLIQDNIKDSKYAQPIIYLGIRKGELTENEYVRLTRKKYWNALFSAPQFMEQLTSGLQKQLFNRIDELADYEFSSYNIYQLMQDMNKKVIGGIEQTIMDLFDDWTRKYHWDENAQNRHYFDGWRTNDAFAVNKRVIIPFYNAYSSWSGKLEFGYEAERKLSDIEKVFNYLDGGLTDDGVPMALLLQNAVQEKNCRKIPLKYFYATFYKKGTCHLEFRNMDLLAKFNIFAARHKNWLPPAFGRKHYKDLDREEKAVVDSFMGDEKSYEKIVDHPDYFLADASEMLMLPGA